ncbi:DNA replication protein DnaC [Sinorhizobium terangae]|nr:DNA replication protein DnaC [Sinorhizobium terangae]
MHPLRVGIWRRNRQCADKRIRNRLALRQGTLCQACIEDIDFAAARGLDRRNTMALAQGQWLTAHEGLIITGHTGTGKSWLACAFGRQAARPGHSVLYVRVPRMFQDLALARRDGSFPRLIDKLTRVQLLILDDFGTHALSDQQRFHLFEIVEERYQRKSTLLTAQVPMASWHDLIADSTVADAILDRIVHNADRITLPPRREHAKAKKRSPLDGCRKRRNQSALMVTRPPRTNLVKLSGL